MKYILFLSLTMATTLTTVAQDNITVMLNGRNITGNVDQVFRNIQKKHFLKATVLNDTLFIRVQSDTVNVLVHECFVTEENNYLTKKFIDNFTELHNVKVYLINGVLIKGNVNRVLKKIKKSQFENCLIEVNGKYGHLAVNIITKQKN